MPKEEEFEKEKEMPYIIDIEEIGIEKGISRGILRTISHEVEKRFGKIDLKTLKKLESLEDQDLEALAIELLDFKRKEDFLAWIDSKS